MKYMKVIVIIAGLFVGALAVYSLSSNNQESDTNAAAESTSEPLAMHEQYENLPEDNRFSQEPYEQIMDRFESGTGIIFLGFKECPWCQKMTPILNEAAEAEDADIHYLDIRQLHEENELAYEQLVTYLRPYIEKEGSTQLRITTPDISFVKDGEIMWRYEMDAVPDEERTPNAYWTAERKEQAIQTFREQIKHMKEG